MSIKQKTISIISKKLVPVNKMKVRKGEKYHNLLILDDPFYMEFPRGKYIGRVQYVKYQCLCDKKTTGIYYAALIYRGDKKDCGCVKKQKRHEEQLFFKDGKKRCSRCKEIFPLNSFYMAHKETTKLTSQCKTCSQFTTIKRRYNLSESFIREYLKKNKFQCEICSKQLGYPTDTNLQTFYIDHDHITNKFRGILCQKCNTLLGYANDDIKIFESCINYLNNTL